MSRSPSSLIPSAGEQSLVEKRDDKVLKREEGKANSRAVINVNVNTASSTPPTKEPQQLELFPGRACPSEVKPATRLETATESQTCRDGVLGDSTRGKRIKKTGETLYGLAEQKSLFDLLIEHQTGHSPEHLAKYRPTCNDGSLTAVSPDRAATSSRRTLLNAPSSQPLNS